MARCGSLKEFLLKHGNLWLSKVAVFGAVLAAITPPMFAFIGALAFMGGLSKYHHTFWYLFVLLNFIIVWVPMPEFKYKSSIIKRIHRYSAIPVAGFTVFHLFNILFGIISLNGQNQILLLFRSVYRLLPIEIVLILSTGVLLISGVLMALKSVSSNATKTILETLSGLYLTSFLLAHLTAVLFLGRTFLKVDTNFIWASGGEPGLLVNPYYTYLPSYYFLAVVALFIHIGSAVLPVLMKNSNKQIITWRARIISFFGVFFATVCTAALCGYHFLK